MSDDKNKKNDETELVQMPITGRRYYRRAGDIREAEPIREITARAGQIYHFAAQVAVTTSLDDPIGDFEINARGTLNLLEAVRALKNPPSLLFTSTNKVYGDLNDVKIDGRGLRYEPEDPELRSHGFS